MAIVKGLLGQAAPGAASDTDLYTVPNKKAGTVKIIAGNRGSDTVIRIWVGIAGEATTNKQYLVFDKPLIQNEPLVTSSFMIGSGDIVRVRAGSADVSFSCTGIEEDT